MVLTKQKYTSKQKTRMFYALKFCSSNQRKYFQRYGIFTFLHFIRSIRHGLCSGVGATVAQAHQNIGSCSNSKCNHADVLWSTKLKFSYMIFCRHSTRKPFCSFFSGSFFCCILLLFRWILFCDFVRKILYIFLLS